MFDELVHVFGVLQTNDVENPLHGTLRLANLALKGVLGPTDFVSLGLDDNGLIDLAEKRAE